MTLDLGDTRWIKELRMLTLGDDSTPKTCLLQRSLTAGSGPFVTVKSFTVNKEANVVLTDEIKGKSKSKSKSKV